MQILHNKVLTEKLPVVEAKSEAGIFLPKKPEQHYKVLQVGPKATVLKEGYVIKPFPFCEGIEIEGNHVLFSIDQIDDIISKT